MRLRGEREMMYAINGVKVKKAHIGVQTGKLGYMFDYSEKSSLFAKAVVHKLECRCIRCVDVVEKREG